MKLAIAQYTNLTNVQNSWIVELSNLLNKHFEKLTFGSGLDELYFGLITVRPEFDQFHIPKRPRYFPGGLTTQLDGIVVTANNCAEIDIKIEFSEISPLRKNELLNLVSIRISKHLNALTRLSKLKKFNYKDFENEFNDFLSKQGYLSYK